MAKGTQRRLTTIVAADIAGFSRLVGADEEGTLATQRAHRAELIEPLLAEHHGRIANTAGDSFLFEFPSAVEAVRCSIAVQDGIADRNRDIAADQRIEYRIGINVGDVMSDGDDLLGDGVNIAARLENLCTPGGIILSDDAYRQVRDRLDVSWEDGGEHEVKNIARPVTVWRWSAAVSPTVAPTAVETPLPLPDKPSIAVLPFDNMSGDPEQEYFADGIAEDIITALSKFRWFFVTARNSTFAYKGKANDIKEVGRELGVRYVLEGSVRKAGDRVRITAQLIEAETGNHIWAERFDRKLDDIFELQDEITLTIASTVEPELANIERDRILHKPTEDLEAWGVCHIAVGKIWQLDIKSVDEGISLLTKAIELDPQYGQAYAYLAFAEYFKAIRGYSNKSEERFRLEDKNDGVDRAISFARKALSIDTRDYVAHWIMGRLHHATGDHSSAIRELETSININPNFAQGYNGLSLAYVWAGNPEKGIEFADIAIRLSPHDPLRMYFYAFKGIAYGAMKQFEKAVEFLEEACRFSAARTATIGPITFLAVFYAQAGKLDDAFEAVENARRIEPNISLRYIVNYLQNADQNLVDICIEGGRKAGLSE